ncbi:MAG: DUF1822 family protein [Synechocystis sp.]
MTILTPPPTIPLTAADRQFVKRIAVQSRCPQPRLQNLIPNLLAVRAVSHWLDIYDIPYDWQQSYCINPLIHLGDEVADLYLPGLGRLECRAVAPGDATVHIPAEVWTDRLGYCVVEITDDLQGGQLIGFLASVERETISTVALQPIDALFGVLAAAESRAAAIIPETVSTMIQGLATTIQTWVTTAKENAWEIGEFFFVEPSFAPARGASTLAKVIGQLQRATSDAAQQRLIITVGELAKEDDESSVIDELVAIINTTQNDDTRWLAAGTLARIAPQHPQAAHCLKKTIGTYLTLAETPLELIVSLMPNAQQEIAGIIELKSATTAQSLPIGLRLSLLSETNQLIDEIVVTANQTLPQTILKISLDIEPGTDFRVCVTLGDRQIIEDIHL